MVTNVTQLHWGRHYERDLRPAINNRLAEFTRCYTEGKLGGQALVPGVAGTWKDLTDNVNSMASNSMRAVEKILIVDDDRRNLDVLEAMLEDSGCTCVRAQSADEALLALMDHEFAAMILDIHMPGMSGIELANLVKQRRRTQDVPILFLTAHLVDDGDVLRGYSVGAVDYLSKPVNANILAMGRPIG